MHFTLRELSRFRVPLIIWIVVTAVAAVAGPFGTHEAMGLGARTLYWGGVAGGSILLNFATRHLARDMARAGRIAMGAVFVVVLAGLAHGLNSLVFPIWGGLEDWLYLTANVGLVTAAVSLVIWAVVPEEAPVADQGDAFLRRLPIDVRGPLVRIEAQDHYLNVVTARGSTLILMRLGDAISELADKGLQVHRSHWVAVQAVAKHRRDGGRDVLEMADGAEVPVSRSFRKAAQEAGLF